MGLLQTTGNAVVATILIFFSFSPPFFLCCDLVRFAKIFNKVSSDLEKRIQEVYLKIPKICQSIQLEGDQKKSGLTGDVPGSEIFYRSGT